MTLNPTRLANTVVTIIVALASSCASLTQPAPDKATFAIDPGPPAPVMTARTSTTTPSSTGTVLRVRRLLVASPYNTTGFVYRTGQGHFRTDYYNGFIAAPDQLLTGVLIHWLSRTGPFETVVDTASGLRARYILEGNVTALYGDYTDKSAPQAVLSLKTFLFDDSTANLTVIFQKEYEATSPITIGSAESLVRGWDNAYRKILEDLTTDLHNSIRGEP